MIIKIPLEDEFYISIGRSRNVYTFAVIRGNDFVTNRYIGDGRQVLKLSSLDELFDMVEKVCDQAGVSV